MQATRPTTSGQLLFWLVVQSWVLLPSGLGQLAVEGFPDAPWSIRLIDLALVAGGVFLVARNLVRLWRVPVVESSRGDVIALTLVGLVFTLLSLGPVFESDRWSTRPLGGVDALIGAALLVVGARRGRDRTAGSAYSRSSSGTT